ncbi:hypothetical protein [Primorskyibacter sp. S87]|uniref:hypothetical protein n=1 Tax=Primorskyibacter sp. S87 TaxID=3415126 RepID=UPI003C7BE79B
MPVLHFRMIFSATALAALPVLASAADFMTEQQLVATFPGSTLYGVSEQDGKTQWAQTYGKGRKKGKVVGNFGGEKYNAKWFVKDGMWCEDWGSGSGCWHIERVDGKTFQPYKDGNKRKQVWRMK